MNKPNVHLIIRNDDLSAFSVAAREEAVQNVFDRYDIPQVAAVIPRAVEDIHNPESQILHPVDENRELVRMLAERVREGRIEIAQHGYTHKTSRLIPALTDPATEADKNPYGTWPLTIPKKRKGFNEFDGLTPDEVVEALDTGRQILNRTFDVTPKTFVFPWDRLNKTALNTIGEQGFKYVLCATDKIYHSRLSLISYILRDRDIFLLPEWLNGHKDIRQPFLIQITYHSWMFTEEDLTRLDRLLKFLAAARHVRCVLPAQLETLFPGFAGYVAAHDGLIHWHERNRVDCADINRYRSIYVLSHWFYSVKWVEQHLYSFLVGRLGLRNFLLFMTAFIALGIIDILLVPRIHITFLFLFLAICVGTGFLFWNMYSVKRRVYGSKI